MDPSIRVRGTNLVDGAHAAPISSSHETFSFSNWLGRQVAWMPSWLTCVPLGAVQTLDSHVAPHISWASSHITTLFTGRQDPSLRKNSPQTVLSEVGAQFNRPEDHSAINQLILDYATPRSAQDEVRALVKYPLKGAHFINNQPLRALEKDVRNLTKNGGAPYHEFADCYLSFFSIHTQLYVLREIDDFMNLAGSWNSVRHAESLLSELLTTILEDTGHTTEEILDHLNTSGWFKKAHDVIKIVEKNIERVIEDDSKAFQEFCKKRKNQFNLPYHGARIHRALKRTGFVYSPKMVIPDRMICLHCKVQVSGFRAWYDPQSFHRADIEHPAPALLEKQPDVMHTGSDTTSDER